MKLIAAVNNNWGIGKENDLLYHIPTDMKFFRNKTKENVIIIGRKTLESFPNSKPLPNRVNIVLTRDENYNANDVILCNNQESVLEEIKKYPDKEIYICGGEQIYKLFLPYCLEALITKVYDNAPSQKFMTNLDDDDNWVVKEKSEIMEENGLSFQFFVYENKNHI